MTQLTDKHLCEPLPNGNYGEGLIIEVDGKYYLNLIDENGEMLAGTKPLPPGTYRFLFTTATATEEDARKVVSNPQYDSFGCYEVWSPYGVIDDPYETAKDALDGLLRSKKLDENKNYAISEKLK